MPTDTITTPEQEANVLSNLRQDWKSLHRTDWVTPARARGLRRQIRHAIARVRAYRSFRSLRKDTRNLKPETRNPARAAA